MNNQDSVPENNLNQPYLYRSKKTPAMKYLQNPFSIAWSKLAALTKFMSTVEEKAANDTKYAEESETDSTPDENEYIHLTDWVEPSIYFTIFCPNKRL